MWSERFGIKRAWRVASKQVSATAPDTTAAPRSRKETATHQAAKVVRTEATAATVLVSAAAAAVSIGARQASETAQMHQQQAQASYQEWLQQFIQQHHQLWRALLSCISSWPNCRRRQQRYRLHQPVHRARGQENRSHPLPQSGCITS